VAGQEQGPLPDGFAEQLARVLAPEDREAGAAVLVRAAELDDDRLAEFLEALTARVRESEAPLTAAELKGLLPRW
jgi:uroporphyrinogen-III synthase